MGEEIELGRVARKAWMGDSEPSPWSDVNKRVREKWEEVGRAVRNYLEEKMAALEEEPPVTPEVSEKVDDTIYPGDTVTFPANVVRVTPHSFVVSVEGNAVSVPRDRVTLVTPDVPDEPPNGTVIKFGSSDNYPSAGIFAVRDDARAWALVPSLQGRRYPARWRVLDRVSDTWRTWEYLGIGHYKIVGQVS